MYQSTCIFLSQPPITHLVTTDVPKYLHFHIETTYNTLGDNICTEVLAFSYSNHL